MFNQFFLFKLNDILNFMLWFLMKYVVVLFFLYIVICLKSLLACPNLNAQADDVLKVPSDMLEGNGLVKKNVYSNEEWNLIKCDSAKSNLGALYDQYGDIWFPKNPNIQIEINYLGGYYLTFESDMTFESEGYCDSYVLVKDPNNSWGLGNKDFPASFYNPQDGMYLIWVGKKSGKDCNLSVTSKANFK